MRFVIPYIEKGVSGVYHILIDDKWFYIGSSKNLKGRISTWKSLFKNKDKYGIHFFKHLTENSVVVVSILKIVPKGDNPKVYEDLLIREFISNDKCLNIKPSAIKKPYIKKIKIKTVQTSISMSIELILNIKELRDSEYPNHSFSSVVNILIEEAIQAREDLKNKKGGNS